MPPSPKVRVRFRVGVRVRVRPRARARARVRVSVRVRPHQKLTEGGLCSVNGLPMEIREAVPSSATWFG